ncbi:MAG TPA: urate hydroxylase PuuD [Caulobacteraceae bacterium]|nr:urate hydroxylase PuuD [Caulobacteraceae bacterium]
MGALLQNFRNTVVVSLILALVMISGYAAYNEQMDQRFWEAVARWLHVVFGILWIGLLYYFNFVQIRKMPDIPAELKPAISKHIAPEALFWFRWAALFTLLAGLALALTKGHDYTMEVLSLGMAGGYMPESDPLYALLGAGVWLAIVMFLNVWVFIWPNQKIALGIVEADADRKAKAAKTAMLFSRTNMLLSLPMLVSMTMSQTLY